MNPKIYSDEEIELLTSLLDKFRQVIVDDYELYGFSLKEMDDLILRFPNVDLIDEEAGECDHSGHILNNIFAFLCANQPVEIVEGSKRETVLLMWQKLKSA